MKVMGVIIASIGLSTAAVALLIRVFAAHPNDAILLMAMLFGIAEMLGGIVCLLFED